MSNRFLFTYSFRLIELLAAIGIVLLAVHFCRAKPDGAIARFLRHRDRIWFALLLLFVPAVVSNYLFSHFFIFMHPERGGSIAMAETAGAILDLFYGTIYAIAACLFASPSRKDERFGFWTALAVAIILIVLFWGVSMVMNSLGFTHRNNMPVVLVAGILAIIYLAVRASRGKNAAMLDGKIAKGDELKKGEFNPAFAFVWLLVGLAPVPILLIAASANAPHQNWVMPLMIICPLCNLCGGIGCVGGIKNAAVRIILGLFLAAFFFGLSVLIALLQACSHSGGI